MLTQKLDQLHLDQVSSLSLHYWMKPNLGDLTSFMNCLVFLGVASASLNPKKKEELAQVATCDVLTVLTH